MGLAQDIVVKSRFSVNLGNGRGSRGGTPGKFIQSYMSRGAAVENITPVRLSESESMLSRFDAREKAVNEENSVPELRHKMKKAVKQGGVAFCNNDPAMSDAKLKDKSREMQEQFEHQHTVMEMVISFTEQYLRDNGCLDPDFVFSKRGDFAGHIDQMKLRLAIMNGLDKLARGYDDLRYVGCIQVDTDHVHCHVCMADFGHGTIASDGNQRGKISAQDIRNLRRGIDMYLDQKQTVKVMSESVMHDKRNVLCYVKKFTHQVMAEQGISQFLMACLPKNRNLWSANSNRAEMRKANAVVREFVMDILQPDGSSPSPMYRDAHESIVRYADARQGREGLSEDDRLKLIRNGEERLVRDCMNGVYAVLKRVPEQEVNLRTPMLEAMSMDYESMASRAVNDPMMEFGFKLRSYSSRLKAHRNAYHRFRDEYEEYEKTENKAEESKALGDYLALERDYQQMLMVKYQHFLTFLPPDEDIELEFDNLMRQQDRVDRMEKMTDDPSLRRMGAKEADNYGWQVYGINRGSSIRAMPQVWDRRVEREKTRYTDMVRKFRSRLQDYGLDFDGHGVTTEKLYPFDDVKALDLHHLGYDFPSDVMISRVNVDRFVYMANRRYDSFQQAKDYLEHTGQGMMVEDLMPRDVEAMKQFADKLSAGDMSLKSARTEESRQHDGSTVRLGQDYTMDMRDAVRAAVDAVRVLE